MAKFFAFFAVLIIGVLGFGAWFVYSATAFPMDDWQGTVQLEIESGEVYVKKGNLEYQAVKETINLQEGDSVKTGANSSANIVIGDGAVLRLDANTELTINQAEMSSMWEQQVNVKVSDGKIWFRILKLFNDQSQWEVETPTVVATVRGTAFSIGTEALFVGESQVAVKEKRLGNRGKEVLVGLGEAMNFQEIDGQDALQKVKLGRDKLDDQMKQWVENNFKNDKGFQKLARERVNARLKKYMGAEPGTWKYKLQQQAEKIRENFIDDDQTKAKWENFKQQRRLAEGTWLAEKGDQKQLAEFLKEQKLDRSIKERILPELLGEDKLDWQKILPERQLPDRVFDWNEFDNNLERLNKFEKPDFNFDMSGLDAWLQFQTDNPDYFRLIKAYTDKWSTIDYTDPAQIQAMLSSPEYLNLMNFFMKMEANGGLESTFNPQLNHVNEPATNVELLDVTVNEEPIETLEPGQTQVVEEEPEPIQEPIEEEIILDFTF